MRTQALGKRKKKSFASEKQNVNHPKGISVNVLAHECSTLMISLVPTPMMMMMMTTQKKLKKLIGTLSPSIDRVNRSVFFFFPFLFVERTFSHRIQNGVSMLLLFIFLHII
jgi:hypothetical protein